MTNKEFIKQSNLEEIRKIIEKEKGTYLGHIYK